MSHRIYLILFLAILFLEATAQKTADTLLVHAKKEFNKGNYQKGLKLSYQAFEAAEKTKDKVKMANASIQLGTALYMNKQPEKEILRYYFLCRKYCYEANIEDMKPKINHNIGSVYLESSQPDSAIYYFTEVLRLLEGTDKYAVLSKTHAVLSELYFIYFKQEYDKSLHHIERAEKYAKLSGDPGDLAFANMKRGLFYYNKKEFKNAVPAFKMAQEIYDSLSYAEGQQYVYRLIADSYAGQYDTNIINAYNKYLDLKDTLFRRESSSAIAKYKTEFETEKKERENKILQQENELKEARITRFTNTILLLVIILMATLFFVFWRINRVNRRRQEEKVKYNAKIQNERDRLSRDLHDNAGSLISFVGNKVDWILKNKPVDQSMKEDLTAIQSNSKKILEGLRETLWTLNSTKITNVELADKLKPYIKANLLIPFKIEDLIEEEKILESETVLNVYRCCQEIINNSNKHSQATFVNIVFESQSDAKLIIRIRDNGVGIKENDYTKENHFGLRNLKVRLDEVGASLFIHNPKDGGTEIKITVN